MAEKNEELKQTEEAKQAEATEATEKPTQAEAKEDPVAKAEAKIKDLQAKLDEMEDKYLRSQAEMANMTNRFKKEQASLLKYAGQSMATAILPAMDNLSRALEIEVDDEASKQLKKGVEMVAQNIEAALKENEVTKIEALGKPFDPTLHQAVQTVPVEEGQTPETVVQVFQEGYMLKDRVLRPAMVVVAQ
ncbi:nucleotide exchange factor GrpE [Ligilactobacillus agilis]|uniref:Protein GrpE n=2 Tax=Ligilactobacillus agilis TaxID=1601 RepID=A0A0R2A9U9_9LACO|nr:nucleotide exchange factor GrpE [Ligilactobacillus agilis]KRM63933.1 GrpE protein [Ligilactobacillus agilis DSM 20509]MBM6763577.1 nucleotide exchange factor GrpE [Ligilactobacillus agilis]MBM6773190.1 nucleotide exchange factor GrpE [Ligilactobacillus agilis]MCI5761405.1 nucleotide exchange factor GrpE [Ligilactobacillus agilis]MDO4456067.1 nucleotide exchange factor GrpE [Ligilactobacillus agilis]